MARELSNTKESAVPVYVCIVPFKFTSVGKLESVLTQNLDVQSYHHIKNSENWVCHKNLQEWQFAIAEKKESLLLCKKVN